MKLEDKSRVFLLANNWVGLEICKYLRETDNLVGLAILPENKQKFANEIIEESGIEKEFIFEAKNLREVSYLEKIKELKPDWGIASFWGTILKKNFLDIAKKGNINFHPGYLPYTRGMNPNVWPFIEGSPAGVTIHYIDEGTDTGDILVRKEVKINPQDTAGSLYEKTLVEIVDLFKNNWAKIKREEIEPISQKNLESTFHYAKEMDNLDLIDLNKKYSGRELIDLLRSRTYNDKSFAHYFENGEKINVGVFLSKEN